MGEMAGEVVSEAVDVSGPSASGSLKKKRAFSILLAGSSVSMFGTRISTIAFPMLVLALSNSPLIAGLVAFASITPTVFLYIPIGALVDRWNPRRVMLRTELLRGIVIALVVISLAAGGRPSMSLLVSAMIAEEILEMFSILSERRYLSKLVERDKVSSAQARIEVRSHAAALAGRPIGPFLFELNHMFPFLADALSFLFSAGSLIWLKRSPVTFTTPEPAPARQLRRQLTEDMTEGFRWIHRDKYARLALALFSGATLISQALMIIFLAAAHEQRLSTAEIGIVITASGAGGTLGSILAPRLPRRAASWWLQIHMWVLTIGLAFVVLSSGKPILMIAIPMVMLGFTGAIGNVAYGSYIVQKVNDGMLARVSSIGQVTSIGACAIGPLIGGVTVQRYGVEGAVSFLFIVVVILAFASFCAPGTGGPAGRGLPVILGEATRCFLENGRCLSSVFRRFAVLQVAPDQGAAEGRVAGTDHEGS